MLPGFYPTLAPGQVPLQQIAYSARGPSRRYYPGFNQASPQYRRSRAYQSGRQRQSRRVSSTQATTGSQTMTVKVIHQNADGTPLQTTNTQTSTATPNNQLDGSRLELLRALYKTCLTSGSFSTHSLRLQLRSQLEVLLGTLTDTVVQQLLPLFPSTTSGSPTSPQAQALATELAAKLQLTSCSSASQSSPAAPLKVSATSCATSSSATTNVMELIQVLEKYRSSLAPQTPEITSASLSSVTPQKAGSRS